MRSSGSPLLLLAVLLHTEPAWSRECGSQINSHGSFAGVAEEKPVDALPWVELLHSEAEAIVAGELVCALTGVDGADDVEARFDFLPAHEETIGGGCNVTGAFSSVLARVTPASPLVPGSRHRILCNGRELALFQSSEEFLVGEHMAAPPPQIAVVDIRVGNYCDVKRTMDLDITGPDATFWDEGGVITVEYEDGSVDWVGFGDPGGVRARLELPAEGEEVVILTAINGAGLAGPPLELDVTAIAGPREIHGSGCSYSGSPHSLYLAALALLLLLRGRGRNDEEPSTPTKRERCAPSGNHHHHDGAHRLRRPALRHPRGLRD